MLLLVACLGIVVEFGCCRWFGEEIGVEWVFGGKVGETRFQDADCMYAGRRSKGESLCNAGQRSILALPSFLQTYVALHKIRLIDVVCECGVVSVSILGPVDVDVDKAVYHTGSGTSYSRLPHGGLVSFTWSLKITAMTLGRGIGALVS